MRQREDLRPHTAPAGTQEYSLSGDLLFFAGLALTTNIYSLENGAFGLETRLSS